MKDPELDADAQLLLGELQLDAEAENGGLGRVRQRLAVSLTATLGGIASPSAPDPLPAGPSVPHAGWLVAGKGIALAFTLGALAGVTGYAWLRPPVVRTVYRDRVVEPAATPTLPTSASPAAPPPTSAPAVSAALSRRESPPAETTPHQTGAAPSDVDPPGIAGSEGLTGELRLLDEARASLGAGNAAVALSVLQTHAARYPHGTLEQEREALRVKALVGAGRLTAARIASQLFAQRYPNSALLDSVNAAAATIP